MSIESKELDIRVFKSQEVYSRSVLSVYDVFVLGFSSRFAWQCSKDELLKHYNQYVSGNHLEVGVGTGYLIDKCTFPVSSPRLGLMDLNQNCLDKTAKRVCRYNPNMYRQNILEPIERTLETYDSIGLNYVLHCVPGSFKEKGIAFSNLKPLLSKGGVLFGSSILAQGVDRNLLSRSMMGIYNSKGIFNNHSDSAVDLKDALESVFSHVELKVVGCVALFSASDEKKG